MKASATNSSWGASLRGCADVVIAGVLSPRCLTCDAVLHAPTRGPVCRACWQVVERQSVGVSRTVTVPAGRTHQAFTVFGAGPYEGQLQGIITALKYDGHVSLGHPLAGLLRRTAADVLERADAVVPVPLHPWRRWTRGFNQAFLVARHLGRPLWPVLMRRRQTAPQASLRAADRRPNVSNAFAVRRTWRARDPLVGWPWSLRAPLVTPDALRGRRLVVIDDVCTTGATIASCMALLAARGARVEGLTVALVAIERLVPHLATRLPDRAGRRR